MSTSQLTNIILSQWFGFPIDASSPMPNSPVSPDHSPRRTRSTQDSDSIPESGYDADRSQPFSSPGGFNQTQTPQKTRGWERRVQSASPTKHVGTSLHLEEEEEEEFVDDFAGSLPDALKGFMSMFDGVGSYPESFPASLRH